MMSPPARTRRQRQLWLLCVIHQGFCGIIAHLGRFGPADLRLTILVLLHTYYARLLWRQAKRYPPQQARRGLAITGLVLGYLSLVVFLGVVGLFIWLVTHPIIIHSFP